MTDKFGLHLLPISVVTLFAVIAPIRVVADEVTLTKAEGKVIVKIDGQLFTEYVFQGHSKPILYPIVGPHGIEMTRNYPM